MFRYYNVQIEAGPLMLECHQATFHERNQKADVLFRCHSSTIGRCFVMRAVEWLLVAPKWQGNRKGEMIERKTHWNKKLFILSARFTAL